MNTEISEQQIHCEFEGDPNVVIFDQDNWDQEGDSEPSSKNIQFEKENRNDSNQMIDKINQQLQFSKENFFKVNVTKQSKIKPKSNKVILPSLEIVKKKEMEPINPKTVLKQGYLEKKTDGIFFKWHLRYVALTSEKLLCFEDERKLRAVSCINLKLLPLKILSDPIQLTLTMDFQGQCQNIIFKEKNKEGLVEWKKYFEKVIDLQSKQKKMLLKTFSKPIYQSKQTMTERQLLNFAETGDILLFYTKNTGAKLQRMLTNSDFDHVAMVVKMKQRDVMVFQSNQLFGVSIYDWNQYLRYFDLYQKVTIRKLNYARKSQIHHSLLNFVKKNLGKKYDINALKFIKLESDFEWQKVKESQGQEERGYFCSELIAKAYKSVGIIEDKKSSGRYWPVDFSERGEMMLKKGVWLGPEQSIILNKHVKNMI